MWYFHLPLCQSHQPCTCDFPSVIITTLSIISHVVSISHNDKKVNIWSVKMTQTISHQNYMAITFANDISVYIHYDNNICHNQHKQVGLPCVNKKMVKTIMFGKHIQTHIVKDNIPHTASEVCVLGSVTCSHTWEAAISVGVVQAYVLWKIDSVLEKLSSLL